MEKERDDNDITGKKTYINMEATTEQDKRQPLYTGVEKYNKIKTQEEGDVTEEYVIDSIANPKSNNFRWNHYGKNGESLYRVRWYGLKSDEDTWGPISDLPRSKVLSFCKRRKISILTTSVKPTTDSRTTIQTFPLTIRVVWTFTARNSPRYSTLTSNLQYGPTTRADMPA